VSEAFGKFELVKKLASGGMGEVWLTPGPDRWLVLKRLHRHLLVDADFERMFLDEAKLSARMVHPNLTRTLELGQVGDEWYLLMELVDGHDLKTVLEAAKTRRVRFPMVAACQVASQVAAGLHFVHTALGPKGEAYNIVHRDVAPANVLLGFNGTVTLIDFGISRALREQHLTDLRKGEAYAGRYSYLAPECVDGQRADHRSDQFSLGALLWEALTGQPLFGRWSDFDTLTAIAKGNVEPPSGLAKDVPPELDAVVLRALAKEPSQRFRDVAAFKAALDECLRGRELVALDELMGRLFPQREPLPALPKAPAVPLRVEQKPSVSLAQLSAQERSAVEQLAVFRGGFSVDAAEKVVELEGALVLDVLERLQELGVVRAQPVAELDGELRFSLALEAQENAHAVARHAGYFEQTAREWLERTETLRLKIDLENFRRALKSSPLLWERVARSAG